MVIGNEALQHVPAEFAFAVACATGALWFIHVKSKLYKSARKNTTTKVLGPSDVHTDCRFKLSLTGEQDFLYERHGPKPFEFNEEVVEVFDDMVSRSVPLYREVADLLLYWVHRYYRENTAIIDLGSSTGTTLDIIAKMMLHEDSRKQIHLIGVDNSEAMVEKSKDKLSWTHSYGNINVELIQADILEAPLPHSSVVILNYTLQFVTVLRRSDLLRKIYSALCTNGIVIISEKIRYDDAETQETCTWIYEDFKERRGYSKRYIARKKDALMNVLVPYTDQDIVESLKSVGFNHVEVIAKWNNFSTFAARKGRTVPIKGNPASRVLTPNLDGLFDYNPTYLADYLSTRQLQALCRERVLCFSEKGGISVDNLMIYDRICSHLSQLPKFASTHLIIDSPVVEIGLREEITDDQYKVFRQCLENLKPWKKGPFKLLDVFINAEWRSDWKWERMSEHLPSLKNKVVCDLGCANGYYMLRMLAHEPRLVVGIDPNLKAWLQFMALQRFSGVEKVRFEYLRGEHMHLFHNMFDVVFCLGVLYHTPDPIGMLRKVHESMKSSGTIIIDCQGISGKDDIALFPRKRYANMKGVYFLPTLATLKNWMTRTKFYDIKVFFAEKLTTDEQRITEWAPVNTSLNESLNPDDLSQTIEGYPAPHRFYLRAKRG